MLNASGLNVLTNGNFSVDYLNAPRKTCACYQFQWFKQLNPNAVRVIHAVHNYYFVTISPKQGDRVTKTHGITGGDKEGKITGNSILSRKKE